MMRIQENQFSLGRRYLSCIALLTCFSLVEASSAVAQTSGEASAPANAQATEPSPSDVLADRQSVIGDRIKRLEDRMFQLAQALKQTDPEKAERLVEGLSAIREDGLKQNIGDVVRLLREQQFADANDAQVAVEDQMQAILKLLMEETNDLEKQREELKRLEEIRQELDVLLSKQKAAKSKAERVDMQKRVAEALENAAESARELLNRQQGLSAESGSGGDNAARPADAQAEVRGETEALARDVAALAETLRALSESDAADKSASSESPADAPTDPNAPPSGNGASADESGGGEAGKPSNGKGDSESTPQDASRKAEEAKEHLDRAADSMQEAEQALRSAEDANAEGDQTRAADELQKAIEKLQGEAEQMRRRLKLEEAADEQRKLAEDASDLLDDMQEKDAGDQDSGKKSSDSEGGESGGDSNQDPSGGSGQESQSGSQQTPPASPGQRPLEEAIPHQQDAAKKLDDNLPMEAVEQQQQAIEKLEQAKEDLDERLDQLRREQQEQLLAALESRFRAMLSRQLEVNKATNRLVELGVDNWKRSDQLELAELSEKQRWVGDEADEAMFLLTEEGSTVVLPPLLEEVRDDAQEVADQLGAAKADREVQMLQESLESVLRDMIDAIKKQQEELEQGGGGGGSGGSPPLLPGSAELKLLRACQLRINQKTESMYSELGESPGEDAAIRTTIGRLAIKQSKVAEMAKSMHESLNKAQ